MEMEFLTCIFATTMPRARSSLDQFGKGTFRAIDPFSLRHTSRSSMGIDFADIDRDGHDDFIVVDMLAREHEKRMTQLFKDLPDSQERERIDSRPRYSRNTLFFGRPNGSYVEAALMAGVAATDWSWCPIFIDVDLDGYEDLLVTNGLSSISWTRIARMNSGTRGGVLHRRN